ncbi:VOC family protein [Nocardioides sp. KR10-350]|uniref:VOC family protein n=1 Tax=Nocardioides cheoyonin TaxID=3156615 RepID=UPI0032B33461
MAYTFQITIDSSEPHALAAWWAHLDLGIGDDEPAEVVDRLLARGATRLWDAAQGALHWITMADPEGNEFCVPG